MQDILKNLIQQFMPFAQKTIGFEHPPRLFLRHDEENAKNPLGKTAFYDPSAKSVTLYVSGRHPKDILRSLGHELVHHKQNCDGEFSDSDDMSQGYAQRDPHLRDMEEKANLHGSMCLRDFEDKLKKENTIYYEHLLKGDNKMSTKDWKNEELRTILSEAWGFKFNTLKEFDEFNEAADKNTGMSGVDGDDKDDTYMGHFKEEEAVEEAHAATKGAASKTRPGEKDYTYKKGEDSKTDKGTHDDGSRKGDDSDTGRGKDYIKEDSGEEEGEHYDRNRMSDDEHIDKIRDHLDALEHDRDYDDDHIDEAQDADDKEDEHLGAKDGKESGKKQSMKDRRKEMRGARRADGEKGDPVPAKESKVNEDKDALKEAIAAVLRKHLNG